MSFLARCSSPLPPTPFCINTTLTHQLFNSIFTDKSSDKRLLSLVRAIPLSVLVFWFCFLFFFAPLTTLLTDVLRIIFKSVYIYLCVYIFFARWSEFIAIGKFTFFIVIGGRFFPSFVCWRERGKGEFRTCVLRFSATGKSVNPVAKLRLSCDKREKKTTNLFVFIRESSGETNAYFFLHSLTKKHEILQKKESGERSITFTVFYERTVSDADVFFIDSLSFACLILSAFLLNFMLVFLT